MVYTFNTARILCSLPIGEQEVHDAICSLPAGKASGPDGFPIEFYKKFWSLIKINIMNLITSFHESNADISCLNRATITLIPQKEGACRLEEFRPISVINTTIKIITKIYADRLQPLFSNLVSNRQTTFIRGRSIIESFTTIRELLHMYHRRGVPAVLFKVDFEKAFDMVSWNFMINALIEKGFPAKWLSSLLVLLNTATSAIKINSDLTPFFKHERGLRQGNPLSPLLFIIIADSLYWFLHNATPLYHTPRILQPQIVQYANNTMLIFEAHTSTM
jgi:Reverse transcriptase (RNA-dependent DNA polymerase)